MTITTILDEGSLTAEISPRLFTRQFWRMKSRMSLVGAVAAASSIYASLYLKVLLISITKQLQVVNNPTKLEINCNSVVTMFYLWYHETAQINLISIVQDIHQPHPHKNLICFIYVITSYQCICQTVKQLSNWALKYLLAPVPVH
jgi:hypothetical protein